MKKIIVISLVCLILSSGASAGFGAGASRAEPVVSADNASFSGSMLPASVPANIPNFDHIVLIVLENRDYQAVIGNPQMPYLNALAQQNILLSNYFAVRHPSLPNYLAMVSGSTQNITSDCTDCFINQPNLADRIEASGRTWKTYQEDMPSPCFLGDADPYYQKHNPFIYFDSIRLDAARCGRSIVPLTSLDSDLAANQLPNFSFIMPNICNSGHNCPPETADAWVGNMVAKLQASPALGKNSVIVITFDEGNEQSTGSCCGMGSEAGGQVATVLITPLLRQSVTDGRPYSHYSLLSAILRAWNLPELGLATAACASSSPTSGTYTATLCLSNPVSGGTLTGDAAVTATVSVAGTSPGVQRVVFYLDGSYLLTEYQSPYTFTLPSAKWVDGSHTLAVEALMRDGFTSQQTGLSVSFNNGVAVPPVNANQFQPSGGNPPVNGAPFIVAAGGDGASGEANAGKVSDLIKALNPNLFLYLGDVYEKGSIAEFYNWYGTSSTNFGQFRSITNPTIGNHEYMSGAALGYFDYWDNIPGYYSYTAGGWHFISLNSNAQFEPTNPQSAQYQWLQQDLAAHSQTCTIVYYHHPFFNIGPEGSTPGMAYIWNLMAQYGVDIVINGHDHDYQRWVPLDGNGQPSPNGITEFVVGSAGHGLQTFGSSDSRVAYSNDTNPVAFGVLLLQLNPGSANFSYQAIGGSILDSGVIPCIPGTPDATFAPIPAAISSQSLTADTYVNAGSAATTPGSTAISLASREAGANTPQADYRSTVIP